MPHEILLTGADGFIGTKLQPALESQGHQVTPLHCQLGDFDALADQLAARRYDRIIHLAGLSHVPTAEKHPEQAFATNTAGSLNLFEAARRTSPQTPILLASTVQVYHGPAANEGEAPWTEQREIRPQNTYAMSKWMMELSARAYAENHGMSFTAARIFTHTHMSQPPRFFVPHVYQTLKAAKDAGKTRVEIPVGNVDVLRDIGSVQDLVQALVALTALEPREGELEAFNVCSGVAKPLDGLIDAMARRLEVEPVLKTDPERVRKGEPKVIQGSARKLTERTGWKPQADSIESLLDAFFADIAE